MSTSIGKLSKSFFIKLLVGIIILPFVFWGMGDVFRGGNKNVIATINSVEDVEKIISATKKYDKVIRCHVKIDTGLNRMGCKESDFKYICESILKNRNLLELEGVYSHLSSSTDPDSSSNFHGRRTPPKLSAAARPDCSASS